MPEGAALPPALALKPDGPVSPCKSLELFRLLPYHWSSEGVSPSARRLGTLLLLPNFISVYKGLSVLKFKKADWRTKMVVE